jgi:hypothetical protein
MPTAATLAELDLAPVLGFGISPSVMAELVSLDARLDRLERGGTRYGWSVGTGHRRVTGPDHYPWGALGRVLSYRAAADDLVELSVDLWRQQEGPLAVQATLVVGCFCEVDHEIHTVAEQESPARDDLEVRDALLRAVTALESWVGLGLDPDGWRARAGLPLRPGRPAVSPGC